MKRLLILMLCILLVATGCGPASENTVSPEPTETASSAQAPEQVYNAIYSGEVSTLNYLTTASQNEFALASNFVDTLIDYDKYGIAEPALAESWTVSEDLKTWTFKIRPNVNWYTFKGEIYAEVTAQDWVDAMAYILNPDMASETAQIAYSVIENAEAFYNGELTDFGQVGVKAIDKYTLEYKLTAPTPYFLSMLNYVTFMPANGAFLEESENRFGTHNSTLLYNGAYILETFEPQSRRVLVKNENYWDKDKIFIETINYRYNKEADAVAQELYLRGEISDLSISSSMLDEWVNDPEKKAMMRPGRPSAYSFFFSLNFDPKFEATYEPENWKVAVNNLAFRKSLFHGINRTAVMLTHEPYDPQNRIINTITPPELMAAQGTDFTAMPALAPYQDTESYNKELAATYKAQAMKELAGVATFPVKILYPYNSSTTANANRAQVIEQQLETELGSDFIDIIIQPFPPTGFLKATRRAGNYALMEVNWGPDYADPHTYSVPFERGSNYNFAEYTTETTAEGQNKFDVYEAMVKAAHAEVGDVQKRYEGFAAAEAFMIDNAWVIPFSTGGGGYVSSKINPFEIPYSPFGVAGLRWKGVTIMDQAMDTDTYYQLKETWETERKTALKNQ